MIIANSCPLLFQSSARVKSAVQSCPMLAMSVALLNQT